MIHIAKSMFNAVRRGAMHKGTRRYTYDAGGATSGGGDGLKVAFASVAGGGCVMGVGGGFYSVHSDIVDIRGDVKSANAEIHKMSNTVTELKCDVKQGFDNLNNKFDGKR